MISILFVLMKENCFSFFLKKKHLGPTAILTYILYRYNYIFKITSIPENPISISKTLQNYLYIMYRVPNSSQVGVQLQFNAKTSKPPLLLCPVLKW